MKYLLVITTSLIFNYGFSQTFLKENEREILSFETNNGKKLSLAVDTANNYLVYRFGSKGKIEFEYPQDLINSYSKFNYSSYSRGGGLENEGVVINNLHFINGNFRYVVFDNWYSKDDLIKSGIRVINLNTNKVITIKALTKSRKGSLDELKGNEKIKISKDFYE